MVATAPGKPTISDPGLRDRLYELLEQDHLPHSVGSRFVRLVIAIITVDVLAAILASVPEFDAQLWWLFTAIEIAAVIAFALEYAARLWSVVGRSLRDMTPLQARLEYAFSALGVIDLLAFLPSAIALVINDKTALVLFGMLPFLKLVRYSTAMRSLLAALHAERRTLFGCVVILTGAVLLFASLLYAIEHKVQPDKFGTMPQAMWWAIVTLGTVGYGDVVPVTPLGRIVTVVAIVVGFAMIALPVAIVSTAFADEVRRRDFVVTWGMLARVPLFSHLNAADIADIMRLLRSQTIEAGEVLVRRGDAASSMYFITAGEVEIDLPSQLVKLADGAFFGEIALLRRTNRSGTVTARRKTKLLVLDAQDFHALIERMPALAAHVRETAEARLADPLTAGGDLAVSEIAQAPGETDGGIRD
ncbi:MULTISPECIES: cyclic nucleotide-gated ion channel [unclassified Bradyrhizobium]|uniref:cyclic nucleotide-gated ion channel n=1 Tax=unclassified Bradyrhizobium TaxID=2631580 RepID=UPI0004908363|nr:MULTISPECIES: cyclic nucleotide-gated ion channel [unclassified Bradyrhizobium]QIG99209.1 cyclic nucleotide-binding domain-containing protein [Bradyrhizobium sp. 6(2017)]